MKIRIETRVSESPKNIFAKFTKELFMDLQPPGIPVKLLQFDGCKKGDLVRVQFPLRIEWTSQITDTHECENEVYFIDKGKILPFGLQEWTHKHSIKRNSNGSSIIDSIEYKSSNKLTELILFPAFYGAMLYRKPIYKKWFGGNSERD